MKIIFYSVLSLCSLFSLKYHPGQIIKTQLEITVRNEVGNLEKEVNVRLFANQEDYDKLINPIVPAKLTDEKGKVHFSGLEPKIYFMAAEKGDKDNFGAGEKTEILKANRINKITVIISE